MPRSDSRSFPPSPDAVRRTGTDELRAAFERERTSPHLTFTIGLTMACNFACPYCFEEHRNEHMSGTTADAVFAFMQAKLAAARAQSIFVNWFGGEPLLNVDVLCDLSQRVRTECERIGARYQSLVITNGALLTRAVAERLRAAGVTHAQVTLDVLGIPQPMQAVYWR